MSKKPENVSISASSNPELHESLERVAEADARSTIPKLQVSNPAALALQTPTKSDTVQFLRLYNRWRRGDPNLKQPCPRVVGEMIDAACDEIETKRDILPTRH